jgi:DNA polymerase V
MTLWAAETSLYCPLPVHPSPVAAGFPSPAEDYIEGKLDLNEHLIRKPAATFFMRATGQSMVGAGVFPGDLLVVDRSINPQPGDIVIAAVDGELTVKILARASANWSLQSASPDYPAIELHEGREFSIWGVVTSTIRQFTRRR